MVLPLHRCEEPIKAPLFLRVNLWLITLPLLIERKQVNKRLNPRFGDNTVQ